jgi:hypothetical protein
VDRVCRRSAAVKPPEHPEGKPDHPNLVCCPTVLHVVPFTVAVVPETELGDGQAIGARLGHLTGRRSRRSPRVSLSEEPVIRLVTLGAVEPAEVVIVAVDVNDAQILRLVVAVLRDVFSGC